MENYSKKVRFPTSRNWESKKRENFGLRSLFRDTQIHLDDDIIEITIPTTS
jgi:hypothetical protein